jgi:hypothetical protein
MRLSDLKRPTYLNQITSLDLRKPISWLVILLAALGIAAAVAFLLTPSDQQNLHLGLAVVIFAVFWVDSVLMRRIHQEDERR